MQSSESSNSPNPVQQTAKTLSSLKDWERIVVWICRLVLGATFIFSGWAKAVDIWGVVFKVEEYIHALTLDFPRPIIIVLATGLTILEFSMGFMLLLGCFRRWVTYGYVAFMTVMTTLTCWIFISDPVSDCGCFGEVLVISNGATFLKNIVLLALSIFLLGRNAKVASLIAPRLQWMAAVATCAYALFLAVYGFNIQPLFDFRPFPIGTKLTENHTTAELIFIYEKNGERHAFNADSLPDDDWTFVERREGKGNKTNTADLVVFDADGDGNSIRDIVDDGKVIMLVVTEPRRHGISRIRMANRLYQKVKEEGGEMIALVATSEGEEWARAVHAQYPVYTAEDTDLKMLVRGEAALVFLNDYTILWKRNLASLPPDLADNDRSFKEILKIDTTDVYASHHWSTTILFLAILAVLSMLTLSTRIATRTKATKATKNYTSSKKK